MELDNNMKLSSIQYVPLNLDYIKQTKNLFITLLTWRYTMTFVTYNFINLSARMIRDTKASIKTAREASGLSRQTFDAVAKKVPEMQELDGSFVILVPIKLIDHWAEWLQNQSPKSREVWTRLYFYIYFNSCAFTSGYQDSVENIAATLKMGHSDVSHKLIELENANFLRRSNYASVAQLARCYTIPPHLKYFED